MCAAVKLGSLSLCLNEHFYFSIGSVRRFFYSINLTFLCGFNLGLFGWRSILLGPVSRRSYLKGIAARIAVALVQLAKLFIQL
jgi:hypothetical protein